MKSGQRYIRFVMIRPCEKALKSLGRQRPSPIKSAMDQFADEWNKQREQEFYAARYSLKLVGTDQVCKERGRVFQVKLRRDYRALLMFIEEKDQAIWLDVFVKNPTDQDRHIRTACDRAIQIRERETDDR